MVLAVDGGASGGRIAGTVRVAFMARPHSRWVIAELDPADLPPDSHHEQPAQDPPDLDDGEGAR